VIATLSQKSILNFGVDAMQPLLSAFCSLLVCSDFGLKFGNPFFGSAELVRKLLRRIDRVPAVLLGNISRFAQKLEDCLTGFIELIVVVSLALSRSCKWDHFGAHVLPFLSRFAATYNACSTSECGNLWISELFEAL
jgi:hypothetical protein